MATKLSFWDKIVIFGHEINIFNLGGRNKNCQAQKVVRVKVGSEKSFGAI